MSPTSPTTTLKPSKSPLHDFPLTFLKWNTKKDRRQTPPPPQQPPLRSSRIRKPKSELKPVSDEVEKQWNLRPRRKQPNSLATAAGAAAGGGGGGGGGGEVVVNKEAGLLKSKPKEKEKENKRFWISLSKDEIEEDIMIMTGAKPSRRPRKHPKIVQRYLDNVFPGLWLVGLTPDSYKTADTPLPKM